MRPAFLVACLCASLKYAGTVTTCHFTVRGLFVVSAGSYLRLIDSCITQLKDQGPARTCNESKEGEKKWGLSRYGLCCSCEEVKDAGTVTSCLRRIDSSITQLKDQGPSRTCNERQVEQEEGTGTTWR